MKAGRVTSPYGMHRVVPGLWMGGRIDPLPPHSKIHGESFDVLVFCAQELQPPSTAYPGSTCLYIPFDDSGLPMTREESLRVRIGAGHVAQYVKAGARTLITCHMGRNRSGLVTALVLMQVHGLDARRAIALVRQARGEHALGNESFVALLTQLEAMRRAGLRP